MAEADLEVEVAYARPDVQQVVRLTLPAGATLRDAVVRSGFLERFPELELERQAVGIYGKPASLDATVSDGDRIEIYRPLIANPKEMRRRRAIKER